MNPASNTKPSVHIHEANANPAYLTEICAGLEEEGIPFAIFKADGDAKFLAHAAANHSRLRVGIGITANSAMMQIRNCPTDIPTNDTTGPILHVNLNTPTAKSQCRALGTNAARAVKGGMFI